MFDISLPHNLSTWLNIIYPIIRDKLNIPVESDVEVINYFHDKGVVSQPLHPPSNHQFAVVFGAAPHLGSYSIDLLKGFQKNQVLIVAADGSATWLLENDLLPDLVFTDLDGISLDNFQLLVDKKVGLQILTHGDNRERFELFLENIEFPNGYELHLSTQSQPMFGWENTLGFTDGDRAVNYLVDRKITPLLLGFDLHGPMIGKYSKPHFKDHQPMDVRKQHKMEIANHILRWVRSHHQFYIDDNSYGPGEELSPYQLISKRMKL